MKVMEVLICRKQILQHCIQELADYEEQVEFDETKMPVFEADNDDFTLTLYNLNYGAVMQHS